MIRISLCDGKYIILIPEDWQSESFECLRYGEPWRDLCGDGMVMALCQEILRLRRGNDQPDAIEAWKKVCADIKHREADTNETKERKE